jgi:endonuclease III
MDLILASAYLARPTVCQARKPHCIECNLERICYSKDKTI